MTRIVVVDDHTLVRQSLIKTINSESGLSVVGEASNGKSALEVISKTRPDLALLDINIPPPDGVKVAEQSRRLIPDIKIVFLTMHDDDASIMRATGMGADGYLPKTVSADEVVQALRAVAAGGAYLHFHIASRLATMARRSNGSEDGLSGRELEILRLMAEGLRPQDVAVHLHLSIKTVKNHLTTIYMKLDVQSGTQAVVEAYRRGLVPLP